MTEIYVCAGKMLENAACKWILNNLIKYTPADTIEHVFPTREQKQLLM